ncbi:MAG: DinB family protein [Pseudomonadota bacterium]
MITVEYCQLMVRYNRWQNNSLMNAASTLSYDERWRNRGAFFGSIAATLNHILWDDALWLERFGGNERPEDTLAPSLTEPSDWEQFKELRNQGDSALETWASNLAQSDLAGVVGWYPAGGSDRIQKPSTLCITHLFNHQTHHRGQVHGMLTAAGASPEATDLPMLS